MYCLAGILISDIKQYTDSSRSPVAWDPARIYNTNISRYVDRVRKPSHGPICSATGDESTVFFWKTISYILLALYRIHNVASQEEHGCRVETHEMQPLRLRGLHCYEVPGTLNGAPVDALPDWGSSVDAVSETFARRHGLEIRPSQLPSIRLLGGHVAEIIGRVVGQFSFKGEKHVHSRKFYVLRKSAYEVVLGKTFLGQTKTLTDFFHRIVERIRPCAWKGARIFLLNETPKDRLHCKLNGATASAIPDTGSDFMCVSGEFVRRHNFAVRREREYRRHVKLIDGSTVYTDGMVLDAKLQFDAPPMLAPELDYDQYSDFAAGFSSLNSHGSTAGTKKATFLCDLHVIEDLPCDIILSNEFIFQNQVFSRFKGLFYSQPTSTTSKNDTMPNSYLLFIRPVEPSFASFRQFLRSLRSLRSRRSRRLPRPPRIHTNAGKLFRFHNRYDNLIKHQQFHCQRLS